MTKTEKRSALIFFALATLLAIAFASGLDGLAFLPGMPFPEAELRGSTLVVEQKDNRLDLPINRIIGAFALIPMAVILVCATVKMFMGADWKGLKRCLAKSLATFAGLAALLFLLFISFPRGSPRSKDSILIPPRPPRYARTSPLGAPPEILVWLTAIAVGLLALALCLRLIVLRSKAEAPKSPIGMAAEAARFALLEGRDFKDTITRCYRRMSREMEIELGIERRASMTAAEFESLLAEGGMPADILHPLTLLFERVRYGGYEPTTEDERQAIGRLSSIEDYSRKGMAKR